MLLLSVYMDTLVLIMRFLHSCILCNGLIEHLFKLLWKRFSSQPYFYSFIEVYIFLRTRTFSEAPSSLRTHELHPCPSLRRESLDPKESLRQ